MSVKDRYGKPKEQEEDMVLSCYRCNHKWNRKDPNNIPKNCPSCRSTIWMKKSNVKNCMRCGHMWMSTDNDPKRCPACGTYRWKEPPTVYKCSKCKYQWNAKREWPPKRCPSCRSTLWAKDKEPSIEKPDAYNKRELTERISDQSLEYVIRCYKSGFSCTKISLLTGIPFSTVYEIISCECSEKPRA